MPKTGKLVFAVCTRNRPEMLKHCIATVQHQVEPDGTDVEIAVIDNSEEPAMRDRNRVALETLPQRFPLTHLHQPVLGIPFARNMAIEYALQSAASALVFLDDDQTVPHDWLSVVSRVAEEENADAVKSDVTFIFEGDAELAEHFARRNNCLPTNKRQAGIRYVSTNGVWISARLYRAMGLRFNEKLGFLGCDDTAFFLEAHARGAKLVATAEVLAQEIVLGDKQNLRWLTRRNFRGGVSRVALRLNDKSRVFYLTSGVSQMLLYGLLSLALIWRQKSSTRNYLRAVKAAGMGWGALGGRFGEYRNVAGK